MPLTIIKTPRKMREFLVYDLEWIPGSLKVRLCGVFDGSSYRPYSSVEAFLNGELTSKNRGKWFYAHAGGLYDIQFVFEAIIRRQHLGYRVRATFSGSSAIIVHVTLGKNAWHFVDSFWLLKAPLKEIGKSIGLHKTGPEDGLSELERREWFASVPYDDLVVYNERDCVILWKAIDMFENAILEFGGQLQMTLASCSMHLFRRRYLKQDIDTAQAINERAEKTYFASRVEVYKRGGGKKWLRSKPLYYYDINSSFPYSMTKPMPGQLIRNTATIPDSYLDEASGAIYIADVEVEVPECYIPTVPIRSENRVFFPVGSWRSWLTSVDIQLLLREGGKITKVHEMMEFEPFMDLADFANDLYNKRKASEDDFQKTVYKLLLNSLYGKFAESSEKSVLHINPTEDVIKRLNAKGIDYQLPGVFLEDIMVPVPHVHVPISAHITALSRKTAYDYMTLSTDFYYLDTDGFASSQEYDTSDDLGGLKLEKKMLWAMFNSPKVYGYLRDKPDKEGKSFIAKAKGMSIDRFVDSDPHMSQIEKDGLRKKTFMNLIEGKEFEITRMYRLKENFRKGLYVPGESQVIKVLRGSVQPKRFMYPDGSTRPWHVDEIEDGEE